MIPVNMILVKTRCVSQPKFAFPVARGRFECCIFSLGCLLLTLIGSYPAGAQTIMELSSDRVIPGPAPIYRTVGCLFTGFYFGLPVSAVMSVQAATLQQPVVQVFPTTWDVIYASMEVSIPDNGEEIAVSCYLTVINEWNGAGIDQLSNQLTLAPLPIPGVVVTQDSQNVPWNGIIRRDIWYQIYYAGSEVPWQRGGSVTEEWVALTNPCEMVIAIAQAPKPVSQSGQLLDTYYSDLNGPPPRPECAVNADQRYRLDTVYNRVILEQSWRFDPAGVWRR